MSTHKTHYSQNPLKFVPANNHSSKAYAAALRGCS